MPNAQDEAFVQLATRRGHLTSAQVQAAHDLRADVGVDEPLAQLLLKGKVLAPALVASLLRELTRGHFACERCGDRAPYDALSRLERLVCGRCAAPLAFVDPSTADGSGSDPRGTGAHPVVGARATGRHARRSTGAYPVSGVYPTSGTSPVSGTYPTASDPSPTGAYPAAARPSGAYPAAGRPTGAYPASRGAGAHPTAEALRPTGACPTGDGGRTGDRRTTGRHATRPSGPHPPQPDPASVPPPDIWDAEATVIDRAKRAAAQAAARAHETTDTVRNSLVAPLPLEAAESTVRDGRVLGLPGRGRTIGSYVLMQELGRGAGGVIYLAKRPGLERRFAVKLLLGERVSDGQAVERFKQEAAMASKVDDPGIVAVYDTGCDGGRYFYVMEYCPGPTLEARLQQGAMSAEEAARLTLSLARTVQAAHDQAVIHRDLKPANVILEEGTGRPRVTDFGVGRDASLMRSLSRTGELLGTPNYMAPEQIVGARDVDHRVDVYALGVILFECVSGRRPHVGTTTVMLAEKVVHEDAPALRSVCPAAPEALEVICRRALSRDRAARYDSARAMARDLERFLSGGGARGAGARRRRRPRRSMALLVALSVAAAVAVVALGGLGWRVWSDRRAAQDEEARQVTAAEVAARAEQLEARAEALRQALSAGRTPLEDLRAEAARLLGEAACPPRVAALAAALDAVALARAPGERPLAGVLEDLEAAVAGARADVALQAELHVALADLLLRRGRYQAAIAHAERALAEPGRTGLLARLLRGFSLGQLERASEAADAFEKVGRDDPDGGLGLLARSALLGRERPEEALSLARRALELEPDLPIVRLRAAAALLNVERAQEALQLLERHLTERPDDCWAHLVHGAALARARRLDEAMAALDRAVALGEPQPDPLVLRVRGDLYAASGDLPRAISDLDRAIQIRPDATALFMRGSMHEQLGRAAAAEADWQQAHALDPEAMEALVRAQGNPRVRRRLLQALGQPDFEEQAPGLRTGEVTPELEARLTARAARLPEPARAPLREALLLAARGAPWSDVDAPLARAIAAAPDSADLALEQARLAVGRDVYEQGAAALSRARALGAAPLELERLEAELLLRRGRLSQAESRYRALSGRDRGGVEGLVARAEAERLLGRLPAAVEAVEAALARGPEHPGALALKGELLLSLEPPDVRGALDVASRGLALIGLADSRLMVVRFRCMIPVALRELRDRAQGRADMGTAQRLTTAIRELNALLEVSEGAGPPLTVASLLLDTGSPWIRARASELLREAASLEPARPELHLVEARFELLTGAQDVEAVLDGWRRARRDEPLLRIPAHYLAEFKQVFGERPELQALVD